jgi:hypothetical protein
MNCDSGGIVPKPSIVQRLVAHHRQRADALGADHVGLLGRQLRGDLGFAGHRGHHRRVAAVVGDVLVADAGGARDGLDGGVAAAVDTGGGHRHGAGFGLHRRQQLGHRLVG